MSDGLNSGGLQNTSNMSVSTALSLFDPPIEEGRIRERRPCQAKPISGIQGDGPFDIVIPSEQKSFIDPVSFRLNAKVCIKKIDSARIRTTIPKLASNAYNTATVVPVVQFTKGIVRYCSVRVGDKQISYNNSPTYGVKAFVHTSTSYGKDAANGHLRCSLWKADTAGKHDDFDNNLKGLSRYAYINGSKIVTICDNIHTELTTTGRYIVPGVDVKMRFVMEDPSHFLIVKEEGSAGAKTASDYVMEVLDFYVTYDRIILREFAQAEIEKTILSTPAIYPIVRTEIRTKGFATGLSSIEWHNAYQGNIPEQVFVLMNTQEAADGKKTVNKYNFQHFNMKNFSLIVNSQRYPALPLEFNFDNEVDCIAAFRHFFDNIGVDISNAPTLIDYKEYTQGNTIVAFDLTGDRCALFHGHEKTDGNVSLEIKLRTPTTEAINVYLVCTYRDNFYIHGASDARKVSLTKPEKL